MFYYQNLRYCFALCLFALTPLVGKPDYRIETQPLAMKQTYNLPNQGILKQKSNGFVYLDVDNSYITSLIPTLQCSGELRPLPTAARSLGAHISVFNEQENVSPEELNTPFEFSVKEIRSFTLHTRDGLKKQWVIAVDAPQLEQLRTKYGHKEKLQGHDFHISLGKMVPTASEGWQEIEELSTFNFSNEATVPFTTQGDFATVDHHEIINLAAKVDAVGQLRLKGNGFVYLDVDNSYIQNIASLLPVQGEFTPITTKPRQMGAHISVINEDEMIGHEIWHLDEAGQWFGFEVKELRYVDRKNAKGIDRLWLLAADAPALQRLRTHHGLKPKLQGHDFHITLGHEMLSAHVAQAIDDMAEDFEFDSELLQLAG